MIKDFEEIRKAALATKEHRPFSTGGKMMRAKQDKYPMEVQHD